MNGAPLSPVNISSKSTSKIRQDDLERQAARDMRGERGGEREGWQDSGEEIQSYSSAIDRNHIGLELVQA